jgi:flagellar assembly factor FliW
MKIKTKPYGEIEVSEKQKIHFPDGLFGFEENRDYFLLDSREGPFYWLQAADHPELAFILIDPRIFKGDYQLSVREEDYENIGARDGKEVIDFAIVTVPEDIQKISANLMGPIIINRRNRKARQAISENDEYSVKHYIMEEMKVKKEDLVETA